MPAARGWRERALIELPPTSELIEPAVTPLAVTRPALRRRLRWLLRLAALLLLGGLLYVALRNAPVAEIWQALRGLHAWQVVLLLCVDALIYGLVTARWWLVVRAESRSVSFLPLLGVRLTAFAVSYFTLGPQVGGEPLQVLYLRRRYGLSYTRSTASVLMDKLFELLGNFALLSFGMAAVLNSGILLGVPGVSFFSLAALVLLISWPVVHIVLLFNHVYPMSGVLRLFARERRESKALRFMRACEHLAGQFCQRHPREMTGGVVVSLIAAIITVSEYALIASFLQIGLPFWQLVTAWTSGWLSFLIPLPGGLGALEASQVSVLGFFGVSAATAIGVTLIMRGRDLLIGGLGLLLAGHAAGRG